ncbi:MAG: 2,3-bisphosphoglycerate-independent phosphoglycerate mutase [Candidatus Cloacimonetes bacterium]|nr:2,3-bisphosphoglycerate-independent phosphoglycerate mutase [Candidatus Cloacimonadota bacterium]
MLCLIIRDGWGVNGEHENNAVWLAKPEHYNHLINTCSRSLLEPGGEAVGLPEGQMGNSEVGHMNIGSGRVIYQDLVRISKDLRENKFSALPVFQNFMKTAKEGNRRIHLLGLLSDGGVHSHQEHLFGILKILAKEGFSEVFIHAFMDGRDTLPTSGIQFIREAEKQAKSIGCGKIATISGRFYAMDRDNRWERIEKATECLFYGRGESSQSAESLMESSYSKGINDEFILPSVILPSGTIQPNDSVLFYNFRPDRARQLSSILQKPELNLNFITMSPYGKEITAPCLYPKDNLNQVLSEVLSQHGLRQLKIAETEKYAHVTYFFNGGREEVFPLEERILVPSPKVETYDLQPEMSAPEVTKHLIKNILDKKFDFIAVNFANPDMVGHTGNMEAAIKAVLAVDQAVKQVVNALHSVGGTALITADHGNLDEMYDINTKETLTNHSLNPVDLIFAPAPNHPKAHLKLKARGKLADIAPTILHLLDIPIPDVMDGEILIENP